LESLRSGLISSEPDRRANLVPTRVDALERAGAPSARLSNDLVFSGERPTERSEEGRSSAATPPTSSSATWTTPASCRWRPSAPAARGSGGSAGLSGDRE